LLNPNLVQLHPRPQPQPHTRLRDTAQANIYPKFFSYLAQ